MLSTFARLNITESSTDDHIDIGFFVPTGDITVIQSTRFKVYPMFGEKTGTISGEFRGCKFKVYSTLVHHLKSRMKKYTPYPFMLNNIVMLRRYCSFISQFANNFQQNHQNLGLRFQLTIKKPVSSAVSDYIHQLKKLKNFVQNEATFWSISVEDYVNDIREALTLFQNKIGRNESPVTPTLQLAYGCLVEQLGWTDPKFTSYMTRKRRLFGMVTKQIRNDKKLPDSWIRKRLSTDILKPSLKVSKEAL